MRINFGTSLRSNAQYLLFTHAIAASSGGIFWIVAARFASPSEVGIASAAISAAMLVATVSTMGIPYGLVRYLPVAGYKGSKLIRFTFWLCALVATFAAIVFLIGMPWWTPALTALRQNFGFIVYFPLFTVSMTLGPMLLLHVFVAHLRAEFALFTGIVEAVVKIAAVSLLAMTLGASGIFISWGLSHFIALTVAIFLFLPRVLVRNKPMGDVSEISRIAVFRFSLTNFISDMAWFTPGSGLAGWILPILVLNLLGAEKTAYFYIVWLAAALMNAIPVAAATSLFAEGSHNEERLYRSARQVFKFTAVLLVPVVVLVLLIGDRVLMVFGQLYAENATGLLRLLALATLPLAFNVISLGIWKVEKNLKMIAALGLVVGVISLGLTWGLSGHMGLLGPGMAWLAGQTVGALALSSSVWIKKPIFAHAQD